MTLRVYLTDMSLANPLYAGATVEVFEVDENLANTGVYATVFAAPTGPALRANPITLDSDGKYPGLHYVEKPVIQRVTRGTEQIDLGIHGLVGRWRGVWQAARLYYIGERVQHPTQPVTYVCMLSHISANFATDLSNGRWEEEFDADTIAQAVSAGLIGGILPNTPETFLRVGPAGDTIEGRTPTQTRGDLSVLSVAQLEAAYARLAFANTWTQAQYFAGGTQALPSITFAGDTDTGLWRAAANEIAISTNASQRMRVADSEITANVPITLHADPTAAMHAVTKAYADRSGPGGSTDLIATPSGTTYDVTGIPSWANVIEVFFVNNTTTFGVGQRVRLGTSSGFVTSGYRSGIGSRFSELIDTTCLLAVWTNTTPVNGIMRIVRVDGNRWVSAISCSEGNGVIGGGGGSVDIGDTLTQIRVFVASSNYTGGHIAVRWTA